LISVLFPTRKRPIELKRTVDSLRATATGQVDIVVYVDEDDMPSAEKARELGIECVVGPRIVVTQCWNECLRLAKGDLLMQANDDVIFRTPGWDQMVEAEFASCEDKVLMVHGSDLGGHFEKFGPHPFVHIRWVEALGYFIPPYFSSDYGDAWVNAIANALGRRKFLPFVVEHMHFTFKKAEIDETTRDRLERHKRDDVDRLYKELTPLRERDTQKLKRLMGVPWKAGAPRTPRRVRCDQCGRLEG
jgi:hypothetical protein